MAWNDPSEITVAANGQVYLAPVGTALPTTPTGALNSAFVGLGLLTEDGVTINVTPEINEIKSWQKRQAVRRDMTGQEITAAFQVQQWNEDTVVAAFGGGAVTSVSGGYRYDFPTEGASLDERAIVIEAVDGSETTRWVFKRGSITEGVETNYQRTSESLLPVTYSVLTPSDDSAPGYVLFSDSTAFAPGS